MIPTWVTLSRAELLCAATIGMARQLKSLHLPDAHGCPPDDGWRTHIEGACGEMAAAKATNRYWPATIGAFKSGDDVTGFQVRTRKDHSWDLIIRFNDRDEDIFVLVTGTAPKFAVHGWIIAKDGKRDEYLEQYGNRPAAWFVPQSVLNPLASLQ